MFYSINLKQAISDIYEAGLKDDKLSLIFEANKEIFMSVNTAAGLTDRQILENIVLQGDTWGSLLASVLVDYIGRNVQHLDMVTNTRIYYKLECWVWLMI